MKKEFEIGKSGITSPFLGMGTWAIGGGSWWGDNDDKVSVETIHSAVDNGIKWIDTAPIYGLYHSEMVVGEALKGRRDKVILSTKCALEWDYETPVKHKVVDGIPVYRDLSKKGIIAGVEGSLKRLGTDYIDVLFTHWQTTDYNLYPIPETVDALETLKKQGKIRAIGASNVTADDIREYSKYGQLDIIQEKFSLMTRRVETELAPVCRELGVSIQAYSPLEQGLLTGKVTMETEYGEGSVRNNNPQFKSDRRYLAIKLIENWKSYAKKYNCSISNLVVAVTSEIMPETFILCGARKPEQIIDNANSLKLELEQDDLRKMLKDAEVFL
ncbi:MAG: aldo/keto reductase [Clostridia bacterium]|nr:aldo/keto reductase [Clostridia bacterium]